MRRFLSFLTLTLFSLGLFAQGTWIPLETDAYNYINRIDIKYGQITPIAFTSDQGYLRYRVAKIAETLLLSNLRFTKVEKFQLQYLVDESPEWLDSLHSRSKPLFKVLYTEPASFYSVSSKKKGIFDLRLNPMLDVTVGGASGPGGGFVFNRSLGLEARGNIKRVLSFYFNGTGGAERMPGYATQLATQGTYTYATGNSYNLSYVPGEAYYKVYNSKLFGFTNGVNYFDARGYLKANILKYINLSFGRDKFFIGDGMRSLILSDYSAPFLFLKLDISYWRFNYENIFAQLNYNYINTGADHLLPVKYMAIHHLTLNTCPWLTVGLFETVIFQRSTFDISYLNPIIFYKAVEASLGNPDKVSIGGDYKITATHHLQFYGQILLNEFNTAHFFSHDGWWGNKWALQFGGKYIDIAPGLDGQIEFNIVRPYTYTADGNDNFTNFNQPLADPFGANFYELIFNLHYQPLPRWQFNAKFFITKMGTDTMISGVMTNYGQNIDLPNGGGSFPYLAEQTGNHFLQGAPGTIDYFELLATYQPWHNINVDASILYRSFNTIKSLNNPLPGENTFMFNIGIRINVARRKYDF